MLKRTRRRNWKAKNEAGADEHATTDSIALAIAGLIVGLIGAWYWLRSARIALALRAGEAYDPNLIEPVELELKALTWHVEQSRVNQSTWEAQVRASREIGRLNAIAAMLTAVALVLSTVSAVIAAS